MTINKNSKMQQEVKSVKSEKEEEKKQSKFNIVQDDERDFQSDNEQFPAAIEISPDKMSQPLSEIQSQQPQNLSQNRQFLNTLITNHAFNLNYIQEMCERLDFLKFLTAGSHCKTLKDSQINILWECLVINAFNEDERDQFFVYCTEILNAAQIHQFKTRNAANEAGDVLFEEDSLEMIFFEILLRLDYKSSEVSGSSFTTKMYQCFERYFIYINEQYG